MNRPDRRRFLKGAGVSLALPMLESMTPRSAHGSHATTDRPQRMVCIGSYLGFYQSDFFPAQTGRGYEISPVLTPIEKFRDEMTIFSGLDHRGRSGHEGWRAWMSGSATGSVSMDQLVADQIGDQTRFASLQLTCGRSISNAQISFTKEGVGLPMIGRPRVLYRKLFSSGADKVRTEYLLNTNDSVLDGLLDEARTLERQVTARDRVKLSEYLASVRDVEKKLARRRDWLDKPYAQPPSGFSLPDEENVAHSMMLQNEDLMWDLMALAIKSDTCRVFSLTIPLADGALMLGGQLMKSGYHNLSHHGNKQAKVDQLVAIM